MPGCLGRLADVLARQLLSWLRRRVEPGSREWLDALTAESECADDGWQRLRWALGGVSLVWTINQRRQRNEPTRGTMRALIVPGGAVLGMIIALALRARFAAYWWAVFSVFNTVGAVWYLRSGIVDLPRYGATQSAMLMAATCGVVLAAIMRETPWTETDSARAAASFLSRHRITPLLIAGTISFALADALIRMRDRLLVADNVNHYAVLGCAMLAAILAGLIGRHGSRPSAEGTIVRL